MKVTEVSKKKRIIIVEPSGNPNEFSLSRNISHLQGKGFDVSRRMFEVDRKVSRLSADGVFIRARLLEEALLDPHHAILMCARGGYGASDLLESIDWDRCRAAPKKLLTGFSDITALQFAVSRKLGWNSLHCPMPGSLLWKNSNDDVGQLLNMLGNWPEEIGGELSLEGDHRHEISGKLFGGCLSVITALIGTPYMPQLDQPYILFLEDVNESSERLLRYWNQWAQSQDMRLPDAIVLGQLTAREDPIQSELGYFPKHLQDRVECPVFKDAQFGHVPLNYPLGIGATARIKDNRLYWKMD